MSWKLVKLRERSKIEPYLRQNPALHAYELGDLVEPHWPRTHWYAAQRKEEIEGLFMRYDIEPEPVLLAMAPASAVQCQLLERIAPELPRHVYVHASEGLLAPFQAQFKIKDPIPHCRMALTQPEKLTNLRSQVAMHPLSDDDLPALLEFYAAAYPGHWFVPEMLTTGCYFGIYDGGLLIAVGGTHIWAPSVDVATIGNIATLPARRGQGLAQVVTGAVCRHLISTVSTIALNVRTDNFAAIRAYEKIGFETVARFYEFHARRP